MTHKIRQDQKAIAFVLIEFNGVHCPTFSRLVALGVNLTGWICKREAVLALRVRHAIRTPMRAFLQITRQPSYVRIALMQIESCFLGSFSHLTFFHFSGVQAGIRAGPLTCLPDSASNCPKVTRPFVFSQSFGA